jgi:predicted  nucleic acid-binding Zn-ribbon protein
MIAGSALGEEFVPGGRAKREERSMESLRSGTFVGAGSFRCCNCDYTLTLAGSDTLTDCPSCGGTDFARASLFSTPERPASSTERIGGGAEVESQVLFQPAAPGRDERLAKARAEIEGAGEYLCYEEGGQLQRIALTREWTRIGRSLAADVRFDDPTVSRRHALIVRHADGVRLLDDRSLNGVFVNGSRVDGKVLQDGDEIIVGRYRLLFVSIPQGAGQPPVAGAGPSSAQSRS